MSERTAFNETTVTQWLAKSQAANRLECSSARIKQLVNSGQLRAVRTQLGVLIDPLDVERLRRERESRATFTAA